MMTNKELSQKIREALKTAGYKNRTDYTISVKDAGYDTSIRITIKNPLVKASEVEKIANQFEEIDRDERTFEILQGCNIYVFVKYEAGLIEEAAADLIPTAEKVLESGKWDGKAIARSEERHVHINKYSDGEWILNEFDNDAKRVTTYRPNYWIRSARDLAIAMWRFKNIGTIYA